MGSCTAQSASDPERTFPFAPHMSAFEGKVDIDQTYRFVRV